MKFDLSSDLSMKGTTVTVDGKALKGEIVNIDFDMYKKPEFDSMGNVMEYCNQFRCSVTTEVKEDDGTTKRYTYSYDREDDEEEIEDSVKDSTPKEKVIIDYFASKILGRGI